MTPPAGGGNTGEQAAGRAGELARALDLRPLPGEGGLVRRTHDDDRLSCALYLLVRPEFSALHALDAIEVYHWLEGAPLRMLLLPPHGDVERVTLGPAPDYQPQVVVPAGVWQGSRSTGSGEAWTLAGLTVVPPFAEERFRLGDRTSLQRGWPDAAEEIAELTRE